MGEFLKIVLAFASVTTLTILAERYISDRAAVLVLLVSTIGLGYLYPEDVKKAASWGREHRLLTILICVAVFASIGLGIGMWITKVPPKEEVKQPPVTTAPTATPINSAPIVTAHHKSTLSHAPTNQPSLDILCQDLGNCPSKELSKRANELAAELESIVEPYYKKHKELLDYLKTIPLGTQEYSQAQARAGQTLDAERMLVMGPYRDQYHTAVIAMREALMNRIGRHNTGMDSRYYWVSTDRGDPRQLKDIAADLRQMAGEALALRQSE